MKIGPKDPFSGPAQVAGILVDIDIRQKDDLNLFPCSIVIDQALN